MEHADKAHCGWQPSVEDLLTELPKNSWPAFASAAASHQMELSGQNWLQGEVGSKTGNGKRISVKPEQISRVDRVRLC